MSELSRRVDFEPGLEGSCMRIRFLLGNENGWVQFLVSTGWYSDRVRAGLLDSDSAHLLLRPSGIDLGYHSPFPQYVGQNPMECSLLGKGECYYDGSSLAAEDLLERLQSYGTDPVWQRLQSDWEQLFGKRTADE